MRLDPESLSQVLQEWLLTQGVEGRKVVVKELKLTSATVQFQKTAPKVSTQDQPLGSADWEAILALPFTLDDAGDLIILRKRNNSGISHDDFPKVSRGVYKPLFQFQNRVNQVFREAKSKFRFTSRKKSAYKIFTLQQG